MTGTVLILATAIGLAQSPSFEAKPLDPVSVQIMAVYSRCVADANPKRATELVMADYRTPAYKRSIRDFAMDHKECVPRGGKLTFGPLAFAGGMAEELMRRQNIDLAVLQSVSTAPGPNGIAACVVRSRPADVATLFHTKPASNDEAAAIGTLQAALPGCLQNGRTMVMNAVALRAMLALASYRLAVTAR